MPRGWYSDRMKHSLASKGIRSKTRQGNFNSNGVSIVDGLKNEFVVTYDEWRSFSKLKDEYFGKLVDNKISSEEEKEEMSKYIHEYYDIIKPAYVTQLLEIQKKINDMTGKYNTYDSILEDRM